jgi:mannose-6-phosphate isomerase-like protein (cupin superfamily)
LRADKANLAEKFSLLDERWNPKIVGELFLVVRGRFRMEFRDRHVWIEEGEFIVVPRGVEHRPVADEEAHVLLFEPASTLNTGNVRDELTAAELDRI